MTTGAKPGAVGQLAADDLHVAVDAADSQLAQSPRVKFSQTKCVRKPKSPP